MKVRLCFSALAAVTARILLILCSAVRVFGQPPAGTPDNGTKTEKRPKPLFRDFMGLNVHTVLFKPELYKPVCRLVRDYHGFDWDVGSDTDYAPRFPLSRNKVNWQELYADWKKAAYGINLSPLLGPTPTT